MNGGRIRMARVCAGLLPWLFVLAWPFAGARADGLTYLAHEPAQKSAHPPLIVLLHGSGADERDMIGLWSQLPGAFAVVSPRAPFADASGGYRWYRKGAKAGPSGGDADIAISRKVVDRVVSNAIERFNADPKRVFIAGFSQGAVMVYEVALHEPGRFRGAAVLSGTLFPSALPKLPAGTDWAHESFFIAHGTADDRIPFSSATAGRDALARLGVPVAFHAYPGMRHGVGDAETGDLSAWLATRIAPETGAASR